MTAFTLRLDDTLARQLDKACREKGYSKTGLVKTLIKKFLSGVTDIAPEQKTKKSLRSLVGIVRLGGDSVVDTEEYFK